MGRRNRQACASPFPFSERTHVMVFSADGSRLASVGINMGPGLHGEVHLWDMATGKEVRAFTGNKERLITIAMAPDGRTIATNGRDSSVLLWEVASGKERGQITGHDGTPVSLDFSPNSEKLAVASSDAPIYLWNTYAVQKSKLIGATLTRKEGEDLWQQLADDAAEVAFQSLCELIAHPSEAVALLEGAWKRYPRAPSRKCKSGSPISPAHPFAVRQTATRELERFAAAHEELLRQALKSADSLESRQRLEKILSRLDSERCAATACWKSSNISTPSRCAVLARVGQAAGRQHDGARGGGGFGASGEAPAPAP